MNILNIILVKKFTYKGSNWYLIKNSRYSEDYVTVMREKVLTATEIGSEYVSYSNLMWFNWTDTCHEDKHGYETADYSNCNGTNDYDSSKVKEMLETKYMPTIDPSNLKEVDGYKIRIIKLDELLQKEFNIKPRSYYYVFSNETPITPTWLYQNFSASGAYNSQYWTMTKTGSQQVWIMSTNSLDYFAMGNNIAVRPVINLLKSAIE